jgi:5-methylcytosine-specific restriction endonuclease McrA
VIDAGDMTTTATESARNDALPTKTCRLCRHEKPITEFYRQEHGKFGVDTLCKPCCKIKHQERDAIPENKKRHAEESKLYRKRHPEKVKQAMKAWLKKNPGYSTLRNRERMKNPAYKTMHAAASAKWKRKNKLRVKMYGVNRRRSMEAGGPGLTTEQALSILSQPCAYCGEPSVHLDHVVPIAKGGRHSPENILPACAWCNFSKNARMVEDWIAMLRTRSEEKCQRIVRMWEEKHASS